MDYEWAGCIILKKIFRRYTILIYFNIEIYKANYFKIYYLKLIDIQC